MNEIVVPLPARMEGMLAVAEVEPLRADAPAKVESAVRFRRIVDDHFVFIWRSLRGLGVPEHSVDDAAQHVFWVASQKLADVPPGRERSFLFGTALGVAANARRSRARSREVLDERALDTRADDAPNGEELVDLKQRRAQLDELLARMPDELRVVFVLFVLEGMTARDIAELLSLAPGTVASRLRRAREAFHALAKRLQSREAHRGGVR